MLGVLRRRLVGFVVGFLIDFFYGCLFAILVAMIHSKSMVVVTMAGFIYING